MKPTCKPPAGAARHLAAATVLALLALAPLAAQAKLPSTPESRAKADETRARTAWSDKVDAFKLCQAQNRVAERYRQRVASEGKPAPEAVATPDCSDPGPFAYQAPAADPAKPIESSEAHSPAESAKSPPSTPAPAAETHPTPKP